MEAADASMQGRRACGDTDAAAVVAIDGVVFKVR
jgi:hypothetical protein